MNNVYSQRYDMLYSMVNMKLRDQYDSLEDFCECEDVDPARLIARLNGAGYEYDEVHNKFTPILDPLLSSDNSDSGSSFESFDNSEYSDNSEYPENSDNSSQKISQK